MSTKFVPAWKDKNGNHFVVLAPNHLFDTHDEAIQYQHGNFLFYIPFGWTLDGIEEFELDDGKGKIPHVEAKGPFNSKIAVLSGPIFEAAIL